MQTKNTAFLLSQDIADEELNTLVKLYKPNYIWRPSSDDTKSSVYKLNSYELKNSSDIEHFLNPSLRLLMPTSGTLGVFKVCSVIRK